jgi:triacylglycerol esterase/lipase EstA (alpha/beta hydrolase family)
MCQVLIACVREKRPIVQLHHRIAVIVVSLVALGAGCVPAGAATASPHYTVGNAATGYAQLAVDPTASPPGVNVAGCRPSTAHPYPVILLPGTLYDLADTWQALGPILANAGYCVFGLNYGANAVTTLTGGRIWSVGDIPTAATQLGDFVQQVRVQTGAAQVDIVGWSQGGMMPRWYMDQDGGARYVHALVGLAPSNHGTTVDGLSSLLSASAAVGLPAVTSLIGCTACTQQLVGSSFLAKLNAGGDSTPGVVETVIETTHDEVVTPYQSAFLSGADDVTLQQQCPLDLTDHLGMPYDSAALQDVVNALGADVADFQPRCSLALPLIGTP